MQLVIALGGNAILQRKEPLEANIQKKNVITASRVIAHTASKHHVILTHGNGPQVGLLALQNDAYKGVSPYPLDVLGAESEGMIGYLLLQQLKNCLPEYHVVAMLTQTLVDKNDSAFQNPTKFVGPVYSDEEGNKLAKEKGFVMKRDGNFLRRVVPSPMPLSIVEESVIRYLKQMKNSLVICVGGGGVPVYYDENHQLVGLEAVIDKDKASYVLAKALKADAFIMLTDVSAVELNYGKSNAQKIKKATPDQLAVYHTDFASGSMGPKVFAASSFVKATGNTAMIGSLTDLDNILSGQSGTHVVPELKEIEFYE